MNYIKIQQDLLKNITNTKVRLAVTREDDTIAVMYSEYACFIPESKWFLDYDKIEARVGKFRVPDKDGRYKPARLTGDMKRWVIGSKAFDVVKIANDSEYCWVQSKLLKHFDNPEFEIAGKSSIIWVYEGDNAVGMVCPFRMDES